jgi:hypothetical protein
MVEVKSLIAKINAKLRSDDPRFKQRVLITHEDGSVFLFTNAFMMRYHNWLLVFAEHHQNHYYDINDLVSYQQCQPINKKAEIIDDSGNILSTVRCSYCHHKIQAENVCSIYDRDGNRIDADICEGCEEFYIEKLNFVKTEDDLID